MRWIVTIEGNARDIERLVAADPRLAGDEAGRNAVLTFDDGHDEVSDETREAIRREVEASLRHINGCGKLRWGRTFEGVSIKGGLRYEGPAGEAGQVVFIGSARAHLTPEEFGNFLERLGRPRPDPPFGLTEIEALDVGQVTELADGDPIVARVLRLLDLMLLGDEDIDWSAAYSALETIEMDATKAETVGWYTAGLRRRFTGTANSIEAVGIRSRHGRHYAAPKDPMSSVEAGWFIRSTAARWLTWRLARDTSVSA